MNDVEDRRKFLQSLGIKTDGFPGMQGEWAHIHDRLCVEIRQGDNIFDSLVDMLAACFFCIRKQQEQIAELEAVKVRNAANYLMHRS